MRPSDFAARERLRRTRDRVFEDARLELAERDRGVEGSPDELVDLAALRRIHRLAGDGAEHARAVLRLQPEVAREEHLLGLEEVTDLERALVGGEDDGAPDHVLELAHVARAVGSRAACPPIEHAARFHQLVGDVFAAE